MSTKLKIGVFGDSYADGFYYLPDSFYENGISLPWVRELDKLGDYHITNFALSGASFHYSAKQFFQCYKDFDKIVFVVTFPGRTHISEPSVDERLSHIANLDHLFFCVANYKASIMNRANDCTQEKLDIAMPYLNALREYYLYLHDFDYAEMYHYALCDKITRFLSSDKLLILPIHPKAIPNFTGLTIGDMSIIDNHPTYRTKDNRPNHLNSNCRLRLATKVDEWIRTGLFTLTQDDLIKSDETLDSMFPKMDEPADFGKEKLI